MGDREVPPLTPTAVLQPSPPSDDVPGRLGCAIVGLGVPALACILLVVAIEVIHETDVVVVNDGDTPATVDVGANHVVVAPAGTAALRIDTSRVNPTTARFPDGRVETFDIDGTRTDRAVIVPLRGVACYALLDVSGYYGAAKRPFEVIEAFPPSPRIAHPANNAVIVPFGALPKQDPKVDPTNPGPIVWFSAMPCDIVGKSGETRAWEDSLAATLKRP